MALPTLRAICKLHDFPNAYMGIELPSRLHAVVRDILRNGYRRQLWYKWQGRLLLADMSSSNCLRTADTRLFLSFVQDAWARNVPIPDLGRRVEQWGDSPRKAIGRRLDRRSSPRTGPSWYAHAAPPRRREARARGPPRPGLPGAASQGADAPRPRVAPKR